MRKSTLILIILWTVSLFLTITFSAFLINDFFKVNNINFHTLANGVTSLSESISDTFDYSEDTIISGDYDAINIETDNKLIIKLSPDDNISISEFHTGHTISENGDELVIKNNSNNDSQIDKKTVLYIPQNKITKLTVKATSNVSIENVNFDQVDVMMENADLNLYGSSIGKLSGTLVDGQLNNSANINEVSLKVNENQ